MRRVRTGCCRLNGRRWCAMATSIRRSPRTIRRSRRSASITGSRPMRRARWRTNSMTERQARAATTIGCSCNSRTGSEGGRDESAWRMVETAFCDGSDRWVYLVTGSQRRRRPTGTRGSSAGRQSVDEQLRALPLPARAERVSRRSVARDRHAYTCTRGPDRRAGQRHHAVPAEQQLV